MSNVSTRQQGKKWLLAMLILYQHSQAKVLRERPAREKILELVGGIAKGRNLNVTEEDLMVVGELVDEDLADALESEGER